MTPPSGGRQEYECECHQLSWRGWIKIPGALDPNTFVGWSMCLNSTEADLERQIPGRQCKLIELISPMQCTVSQPQPGYYGGGGSGGGVGAHDLVPPGFRAPGTGGGYGVPGIPGLESGGMHVRTFGAQGVGDLRGCDLRGCDLRGLEIKRSRPWQKAVHV